MSYPITDLDGVEGDVAEQLKSMGIRTTEKLLEHAKDPKGRKDLSDRLNKVLPGVKLDEKLILRWANMADRMRIKGMGKEYAALLRVVGVETIRELTYRNPDRLAKAMAEANSNRKLVRVLPSEKAIVRWIENAKKLPLKISY
jgi:predicted RecB family nuclease